MRPSHRLSAALVAALAPASCSLALPFDELRVQAREAGVDASDVTPPLDGARDAAAADQGDDAVEDLPRDALDDAVDVTLDRADAEVDVVVVPVDVPADVATDGADAGPDVADVTDTRDVADVTDIPDARDVADVPDARDAGRDAGDVTDAPTARDVTPEAAVDAGTCASGLVTCVVRSSCEAHRAAGSLVNGEYLVDWDNNPTTDPSRTYCDMTLGGFARILHIDGAERCPSPLRSVPGRSVCVRPIAMQGSLLVMPLAVPLAWREVRMRVELEGFGPVSAFGNTAPDGGRSNFYVDGVSLYARATGGAARHLWTWALGTLPGSSGSSEIGAPCPCQGGPAPVAEVSSDYLCASVPRPAASAEPIPVWAARATQWSRIVPVNVCSVGDSLGWFTTSRTTAVAEGLDLRLVVGGASWDFGGEDIGIRTLTVVAR